ncbi:DedA family protein [Candidatus Microgenomates bacterium]|nr:MAG: DedA family protein [Candidatus Microgenomates bacterium]
MDILHGGLTELIQTVGYIGLFAMVFAESGLFFGFFLPGDSLLFTAGFLASQGFFDERILIPLFAVAAILGDSAGYWIGAKAGKWLMHQKESFFFKKEYVTKAQDFYDKHGGKTLILARFIPAVRTFVPIVAGMAEMQYTKFLTYNIVGGILWGAGLSAAGYFLGSRIPHVDKYLLPIILVIIIVSVLPGVIHMRKDLLKFAKKHPALAKILKFTDRWSGGTPV